MSLLIKRIAHLRQLLSLALVTGAVVLSAASSGDGEDVIAEEEADEVQAEDGDGQSLADAYPVSLLVHIYDDSDLSVMSGFFDADGATRVPDAEEVFAVACDGEMLDLEANHGTVIALDADIPRGAWARQGTAHSAGAECIFAYETDVGTSAPSSSIVMPAPLEMQMPDDAVRLSEEDLVMTWTGGAPGDRVRLLIDDAGLVGEPLVFEADAADGALVISAGTLLPVDDSFGFISTNVWADVELVHDGGMLDDGFAHSGSLRVVREQQARFKYRP